MIAYICSFNSLNFSPKCYHSWTSLYAVTICIIMNCFKSEKKIVAQEIDSYNCIVTLHIATLYGKTFRQKSPEKTFMILLKNKGTALGI